MKHVFLLHSNTTLIMTMGVIEREHIYKKDVLLLLTRGFSTKLDYDTIDVNSYFQKLENIGYKNFYQGWKQIKEVDILIDDFFIDRFVLYLPHIAHPFFQIVSTNDRCVGVNILEEGVNCLSERIYDNSTSIKFHIINFIFNLIGVYGKRRYFRVRSNIDFLVIRRKQQPIFYFITPNAFAEVGQYEKRSVNYNSLELFNEECFIEDNSTVFVFEGIVEQGNLSKEVFFESLEIIAQKITVNRIYAKFHPAQCQENIDAICKVLSSKTELTVVPNQVILEFEFLRCKKLSVHGFTTSLLHYAQIFGHQITSYSSLWETDEKFKHFRSFNDFPIPSNL